MKRLFVILITFVAILHADADNIPFTKATDLYYGTAYSSQYNHQLWFTTEGLTYDAKESRIEGTDGMVMRLDLMCPSATNIAGTYEIVGPNYADAPYKMNKKYTYWTYFEQGGFSDQKLTAGTCTITCTSKNTYTITYNVQEINNGPIHQGTITNIPITAITENGRAYTLQPTCTNDWTDLDETFQAEKNSPYARKWIKNDHLYIQRNNGQTLTIMGLPR